MATSRRPSRSATARSPRARARALPSPRPRPGSRSRAPPSLSTRRPRGRPLSLPTPPAPLLSSPRTGNGAPLLSPGLPSAPSPAAPSSTLSLVHPPVSIPRHDPLDEIASGNPLEFALSMDSPSFEECGRVLRLQRIQHRLWGYAVALAIVLFFILSVLSLSHQFHLLPAPSAAEAETLFWADLMAILILGLEIGAQYRKAANKMLFLRQNWLSILAILPIGLLARGFSALGVLGALRPALSAAVVEEEVALVLPLIGRTAPLRLSIAFFTQATLAVREALAHFSVVTDFVLLAGRTLLGLLRR